MGIGWTAKVIGILILGWREEDIARKKRAVKTSKFKSKLEEEFNRRYPELQYEPDKLEYTVTHTYNPDFKLKENVYFETKGFWRASDRAKHLHIKQQHPEVTVYLIFQNPDLKLNRASHTTYGQWATKHGIKWATLDTIPREWMNT